MRAYLENGEIMFAPSKGWAAANGLSEDNYIRDVSEDEFGHGPIRYVNGQLVIGWTVEELKEQERTDAMQEIGELKAKLTGTDYAAIKIAEGVADAEKYAKVLEERSEWRARINELEKIIQED